jgi:excisionase family DNA binding protein
MDHQPTELLTLAEAAVYLRLSRQTLYGWRHLHRGPRSTSAGGRVLYRRSDLDAWLDGNAIDPKPAA